MVKITKEAALSYHETGRPGKIEVKPTKPYHTQTDLSLADALAYSCNVSFATIGETLDKGSYRSTAEELLFNKDLPYDGTYNSSQFRITADSPDDAIPQTVIGQGDTKITPLHNAMIMSAIANDGVLMKPYTIDSIENDDGAKVKTFRS